MTHGEVAGRGAMVFVDDAGGYQLLWDDDQPAQVTADCSLGTGALVWAALMNSLYFNFVARPLRPASKKSIQYRR